MEPDGGTELLPFVHTGAIRPVRRRSHIRADIRSSLCVCPAATYEFAPYSGTVPSLDFNLRSLRGNAVLRWEWREGSTLYVAWQQQRSDMEPYGDFDFGRDRRALFGTRPDNIFLVKMNYWLNP